MPQGGLCYGIVERDMLHELMSDEDPAQSPAARRLREYASQMHALESHSLVHKRN
jgi:hypothetical protein